MMSREAAVRALADVLERENAALAAMDLPMAASLLAAKNAALTALSAAHGGPVPPVALARRQDALAQNNRRLLERAMAAQEGVIGIVARAAAAAAAPSSYGGARPSIGALAYSTRV